MNITVEQLLDLPALKGGRLVAGARGVGRKISSVNIMEVPDIVRYVKGEELLLTTTFPIKDDTEAQKRLIFDLNEAGVSALAIKPVFYRNVVPADMISMADLLDFPIIQLPEDASFTDILNPVLGEILNRQTSLLKRNEETHRLLTDLVLGGGGLQEIAHMLAKIQGNPVSIHSANWNPLIFAAPDELPTGMPRDQVEDMHMCSLMSGGEWFTGESDERISGLRCFASNGYNHYLAIHPVTVARETFAHLVTWLHVAETSTYDISVMEQASSIVALEITKLRAVATVEQRFRSYLIEDIIQGKIEAKEVAVSRGAAFGWDLSGKFTPVLIEIDEFGQYYLDPSLNAAQALRRLWNAVSVATAAYASDSIVVDRGTRILALIRTKSAVNTTSETNVVVKLSGIINQELSKNDGLTASFGVGRALESILGLRLGVDEATASLEIGQNINGPRSVTLFAELGFYRVLFANRKQAEMAKFSHDILGELYESDRSSNSELIRTLEVALKHGGNLRAAARELFVHYNTLRYRMARIKDMSGVDPGSFQGMLNLQMALMIHRMNRQHNRQ